MLGVLQGNIGAVVEVCVRNRITSVQLQGVASCQLACLNEVLRVINTSC